MSNNFEAFEAVLKILKQFSLSILRHHLRYFMKLETFKGEHSRHLLIHFENKVCVMGCCICQLCCFLFKVLHFIVHAKIVIFVFSYIVCTLFSSSSLSLSLSLSPLSLSLFSPQSLSLSSLSLSSLSLSSLSFSHPHPHPPLSSRL